MRNRWIKKEGDSLVPAEENVEDETRQLLEQISKTKTVSNAKLLADLKKRK